MPGRWSSHEDLGFVCLSVHQVSKPQLFQWFLCHQLPERQTDRCQVEEENEGSAQAPGCHPTRDLVPTGLLLFRRRGRCPEPLLPPTHTPERAGSAWFCLGRQLSEAPAHLPDAPEPATRWPPSLPPHLPALSVRPYTPSRRAGHLGPPAMLRPNSEGSVGLCALATPPRNTNRPGNERHPSLESPQLSPLENHWTCFMQPGSSGLSKWKGDGDGRKVEKRGQLLALGDRGRAHWTALCTCWAISMQKARIHLKNKKSMRRAD